MIALTILAAFTTVALVTIALITIVNVFTFPRLGRAATPQETPLVSVLIPARDEATVIGQTVARLLAQSYPNLEILILDDRRPVAGRHG